MSDQIAKIRATRESDKFRNKVGLATEVKLVEFRLATAIDRLKSRTDGFLLEDVRSDPKE